MTTTKNYKTTATDCTSTECFLVLWEKFWCLDLDKSRRSEHRRDSES